MSVPRDIVVASVLSVNDARYWECADRWDAVCRGMMKVTLDEAALHQERRQNKSASKRFLDKCRRFTPDQVLMAHGMLVAKKRPLQRAQSTKWVPLHRAELLCWETDLREELEEVAHVRAVASGAKK